MTTLKRIATLASNFAGTTAKVKLVVTQKGYMIKITEIFGRRLPITILEREIKNSSSTVDELFDRYMGRIKVDEDLSQIIINGTSGTHIIDLRMVWTNHVVVNSGNSVGAGDMISDIDIVTKENTIRVIPEATHDHYNHDWFPVDGTSMYYYTYDDDGELVSIEKN